MWGCNEQLKCTGTDQSWCWVFRLQDETGEDDALVSCREPSILLLKLLHLRLRLVAAMPVQP